MLATKIACPTCSRKLKTPRAVGVGKRLRCSRCGNSFAVRLNDMLDAAPLSLPLSELDGTSDEMTAQEESPPEQGLVASADSPRSPVALLPPPPKPYANQRPAPMPALPPPPAVRKRTRWLLATFLVIVLCLLTGGAVSLTIYLGRSPAGADQSSKGQDEMGLADVSSPDADAGQPRPPRSILHVEPIPPPPAIMLPPDEQARVNQAVEKGIAYLRRAQQADGTWSSGFALGNAALPALTLLECGSPAKDPHVQKAAAHVRKAALGLPAGYRTATYELSLALLVLDRLADPADEELIRSLALRLVAGQTPAGGWDYGLPLVQPDDAAQLHKALEMLRPRSLDDLVVPGPDGKPTRAKVRLGRDGKPLAGQLVAFKTLHLPTGREDAPPNRPEPNTPIDMGQVLASLPPSVRHVQSLQPPTAGRPFPASDGADNSNTQFGTLGLLAAARHGVPLERPVALLVTRFRTSQGSDGTWGYSYARGGRGGSPQMTGAGLLALAAGHGLVAPTVGSAGAAPTDDPAIQQGLKAMARSIGTPAGPKKGAKPRHPPANLYFLWTLERVAMLYSLAKIDGKDWYGWGAETLVDTQSGDGSWQGGQYHGSTPVLDTSLALLFLTRANLAKDLTQRLQMLSRIHK